MTNSIYSTESSTVLSVSATASNLQPFTSEGPTLSLIAQLQSQLKAHKLFGYLVNSSDRYFNETPHYSHRLLEHLLGFTGSFGTALITQDRVLLFTDGRYTLQAQRQVPTGVEVINYRTQAVEQWLAAHVEAISSTPARVGYGLWLVSKQQLHVLEQANPNVEFVGFPQDLVEQVIQTPSPAPSQVWHHPLAQAGKSSQHKLEQVWQSLSTNPQQKCYGLLINDPATVAWLLNIRSNGIEYSPAVMATCLIVCTSHNLPFTFQVYLFTEQPLVIEFADLNVINLDYSHLPEVLAKLNVMTSSSFIQADARSTPMALVNIFNDNGFNLKFAEDPCAVPKAIKNSIEIEGAWHAHIAEGVALVKLLGWLERHLHANPTESAVSAKLEEYRHQHPAYRGPSFASISATGSNGAIIHYRPIAGQDRELTADSLYLLDAGGQYSLAGNPACGTTDMTRTILLGRPRPEWQRYYTLVLKGHIALASAVFPLGTVNGRHLDILARQYLWQHGVDYDHGTGHGVGSYLNVHESPPNIGLRAGLEPLRAGMILSNEPGYYQPGEFGIRIENLYVVVEKEINGKNMVGFQPLTLVPLDQDLLDYQLLTKAEIQWIKEYHNTVYRALAPYLDTEEIQQLRRWITDAQR